MYGPKCVINYGEECTGAGNSGARESSKGKNRNAGGQQRKKRKLGEVPGNEHVVVGETKAAKHRRNRQAPKWRERLIDKARRERDEAAASAASAVHHAADEPGVSRELLTTTAHRQRGSHGRRLFSATADDGDEMLGLCLYGEGVLYENE